MRTIVAVLFFAHEQSDLNGLEATGRPQPANSREMVNIHSLLLRLEALRFRFLSANKPKAGEEAHLPDLK